jgi:hypothetical protein
MNYVCKKCHIRQSVKEGVDAPKCDCGRPMTPDELSTNDKARKVEGMYEHR